MASVERDAVPVRWKRDTRGRDAKTARVEYVG